MSTIPADLADSTVAAPHAPGATMLTDEDQPNFGIDAPAIVATFATLGVVFTVVGASIATTSGVTAALGPWVVAMMCAVTAGYMVWSSKIGKPSLWTERLDELELRGDERVLDVGCGRGLVTVELARRLTRGEVVGVDIWRGRDQSGNSRANTERNLRTAGVADRVEIVDADMTDLPFADGEFDLVTASLSIHNIALAQGRADAMSEIMRVTKPGGRVLIIDMAKTAEYDAWLRHDDWDDLHRSGPSFRTYPPVRTVSATKPAKRSTRTKARGKHS